MKTSRLVEGHLTFKVFALFVMSACGTLTAQEHTARDTLPNFDRRAPAREPKDEPRKTSIAATNQTMPAPTPLDRIKGAQIDRPSTAGAPIFIRSTHQFLTGPDGSSGAVDAASVNATHASDPHRVIKAFVNSNSVVFGFNSEILNAAEIKRNYVTPHNRMRTVVWEQRFKSLQVFGATFKAHLSERNELINVASSLLANPEQDANQGSNAQATNIAAPTISAKAAVVIAAANIEVTLAETDLAATDTPTGIEHNQHFRAPLLNYIQARILWLPMDSAALRLCWEIILTGKAQGRMFRVIVDAENGDVLVRHCLTNDIRPASYNVFTSDSPSPFSPGLAAPASTQPALVARTLVSLSALNTTASPNGWIDDEVMETRGNNVDAHTDTTDDDLPDLPRPQATDSNRIFNPVLDLTQAPSTYKDASVVNLFYWCNWMHDKLYELGFNEAAGNFQNSNFGRGGSGNDAVQADAQDGSDLLDGRHANNANFTTPPDGSPGRMQMYLFTGPTPDRDGSLDTEIVLHEYTHGLSNRLVGGGIGMSALQSQGLGEGWSDFYAMTLLSEASDDLNGNYPTGGYATYLLTSTYTQNYYFGIRRYPYSTDLTKNPLTFKDIDPFLASTHSGIPRNPISGTIAYEVHNMGEVWCVTLWEARAKLITKHGFSTGNQLILQLVTDGMKLAPANPNFIQARDAIIQADLVNNAGANKMDLWAAFAKRGMGADAFAPASSTTTGVAEDFSLPDDLAVNPSSPITLGGILGGPFTALTQTYTLTNTGAATLSWEATKNQAWTNLSSTSGTLAPGASTTVVATTNTTANTLPVGTYTETVTFNNLTSGASRPRIISLAVEPPRIAYYPLNSNPGWTTTGEWAFGHPTGAGAIRFGSPDPSNGATGTNVFGINLSGDYSTAYGDPCFLTAGPFNLTGLTTTRLKFQRWLNTDYQPWVYATIEVSSNGTTWTQIWNNSTSPISDSAWTKVQYDIASVADNQPTIYIRWGHRVGLTTGVFPYSGWNIDDVELLGIPALNTAPTGLLSPSATAVSIGQTVSFTMAASCSPTVGELGLESCDASGTPITVLDSANAYGSYASQTFTWTPTSNGTYYFVGYAKDSSLGQTIRTTPIATITVAPQVATPLLTPAPGSYTSAQSIGLSTTTEGASIRYTTDGSTPSATNGTLYATPVVIASTATLKAIAYASGMNNSLLAIGTYNIIAAPNNLAPLTNQTTPVGGTVTFAASALGTPTPTFQWQISLNGGANWTNLTSVSPYSGAASATLTITGASAALNGNQYRYIATNTGGSAPSNAATLVVTTVLIGPPTFSIQPSDLTVSEGSSINLYGYASSGTPVTYQWFKDNVTLTGRTSTIFSLAPSTAADTGNYKLTATNADGTTSSRDAKVTVSPTTPPVFIIQPQSQAAYIGASVTFTASATALPAPTYQWYKNATAIVGATTNTLTISNLTQSNNADGYAVTASNIAGNVTSNTASLTIYAADSGQILDLAPSTRLIGCGRVVYPMTVRSNTNWITTKSANWISLSPTSARNSRTIEVTVAPNPLPVERTATITVGQRTHTLTQRAAGTPVNELWATGADDLGQLGDYRIPPITLPALAETNVSTIAAGSSHTLFVKTDGTLWVNGWNNYGQLGTGNAANQPFPVQITTNVKAVAAGDFHSLFLKTDGTLWAAGQNSNGQLGDGTTTIRNSPVQIATDVTAIAAGDYHSLFLKTDGSLWGCGYNLSGQLGDGSTTSRPTPFQISSNVATFAAGTYHSLFIKTDGTLWAMGSNTNGQLGDGSNNDKHIPAQVATGIASVAGGSYHSLFIKTDGTLWATGYNPNGQLGLGNTANRNIPAQVATGVASAAANLFHSIFVKTDGTLWATGQNTYYKLGNGNTETQYLPIKITDGAKLGACGLNFTLILKTDGTLWAIGDNVRGQLGYASPGSDTRATPICVASEVQSATAGDNHSLFIKTGGNLWSVGDNSYGQLADGSTLTRSEPVQIATTIKSASAGYNHSLILKTDETLLSTGYNSTGQLGDGTTINHPIPVPIATGITAVSGGKNHSLLLKTDTTLFAAGDNAYGQLGDNSATYRYIPFQIAPNVNALSAGQLHSLFIKTDNTLWATGFNYYGQLGNGAATTAYTPTQITGNYLAAAAGFGHSLFLKSDNTAWSTGYNSFGQLGTGAYMNLSTPAQVLTGVQAIAAGQFHSLWLKTDHTLWAAGDGSSGQLGNGSYSAHIAPIAVAGNIQAIAAGTTHTLLIASGDIRYPQIAPSISGFSPTDIGPGSTVTMNGTNLTNVLGVYFNGVEATSFTSNPLTAIAPANLTAGKIIVSTFDGVATSTNSYTVTSSSSSSSSSGGGGSSSSSGGGGGGATGLWYIVVIGWTTLLRLATASIRQRNEQRGPSGS